ncbi:MAG: phosphotransferase enzyme family protein [Methylococcales bacterium]
MTAQPIAATFLSKQTKHFIAGRFFDAGSVISIQDLGEGLVNDTYLVRTDSTALPFFVLQKINRRVFPFPERITANLENLTRHLSGRINDRKGSPNLENFRLPALLPCIDGNNCHIEESGDYWRALSYIENSQSLDRIESARDAEEVGFALGHFHNLVADLDPDSMQDSLPGFHITPLYLAHYDRVTKASTRHSSAHTSTDLAFFEHFVAQRRAMVPVLENARQTGRLKCRIIHGDPKLTNILFTTHSRKALSMVDLDTVKSGLIHYDIGDCLRSSCNVASELEREAQAEFDLDICEAILSGYFQECGTSMTASDIDYLYDSIRLLPFELGLRFLCDYLEGNRYFKVELAEQNLLRAKLQFHLVRSVEDKEPLIRSLIRSLALRHRNA